MPRKTIAQHPKTDKKKNTGRPTGLVTGLPAIKVKVEIVKDMFKKKTIHQIAQVTNFIQRRRKLDANDFFYR
jgi:hypothetical protein